MANEGGGLDTFGARVRWVVESHLDITHTEFARRLDVKGPLLAKWVGREHAPREDTVQKLARAGGVTPEWLRYGVGHPIKGCAEPGQSSGGDTNEPFECTGKNAGCLAYVFGHRVLIERFGDSITLDDRVSAALEIAIRDKFPEEEWEKLQRWRRALQASDNRI